MSDDALIPRAVAGDAEAFRALAARHRPAAFRIARAVLGDDAAEDVAQEMLLRLHSALPGFRREAELGTWVYRVTMNLCHDHLRREKRRGPHASLERAEPRLPPDPPPTPERAVDAERARRAVEQAVRRLPEPQREALMLRFGSELSYKEIAEMTHTPQGTVASRVFRALQRLAEELEPRHQEILS